jgi:ABC-type sugar transport system ATPase subunit
LEDVQDRGVPVIQARSISKHFGAVRALSDINLAIYRDEVIGLVGDNGAGKSTMVKILSGALEPSGGYLLVDGNPLNLTSPLQARRLGIETVYQDLALALDLSVAANIFLGREIKASGVRGALGWLARREMARRAEQLLADLKVTMAASANTPCSVLSGGQRQAVAVARAAAWGQKLVLMDEPTAALGVAQQRQVGELVRQIRSRGVPVVLISHNMPQVFELCDRIVVFYHGRMVADLRRETTSMEQVVGWITGANVAREAADRDEET